MSGEPTGLILDIQKLSTEDGPGIRTTVFLKGCNLKCAWCHNPESISPRRQNVWIGTRCIGCLCCVKVCPQNALSCGEKGIVIDRTACRACMSCVRVCPTGAMEKKGSSYTGEELVGELLKDRAYYEKSGGGVTLSGGEPLLQAEFVRTVFQMLKEQNVSTALDTAGCVSFAALERVLEYCDLILFDLKLYDDTLHRQFTGVSNERILENVRLAAEYGRKRGLKIWVRTPIIPGATDSEENIAVIGRFIGQNIKDAVERWELCAFNNLCRDKYERMGARWVFHEAGLMKRSTMERLGAVAQESMGEADKAVWSGAVTEE